jgi:hypothetical protein
MGSSFISVADISVTDIVARFREDVKRGKVEGHPDQVVFSEKQILLTQFIRYCWGVLLTQGDCFVGL